MAAKFVELKEAAKLLGVSADQLNEMRLAGDIYGVRDGTSWKFKMDELERVAEDRGTSLSGAKEEAAGDVIDFGAPESDAGSDLELDFEASDTGDSPTAIGKSEDFSESAAAGQSDLLLGDEEGGPVDPSAKTGVRKAGESDLGFEVDSASSPKLSAGTSSSDVALVPDKAGSGVDLVADSSADVLGGDADLELHGSDLDFEGSDLTFGSDVSIGGEKKKKPEPKEKPIEERSVEESLSVSGDEEIALGEDDELVLEMGSDITGGAGDTGINLTSPSDSGLNLEEEPLDLAGSSVSSLELPEDEDLVDLEDLSADSGVAAKVQADEDFQLAPSAGLDRDEEDSGSQVIALEDSEAFIQAGEAELDATEAVLGAPAADELEGALEQAEPGTVAQPALPEGMVYGPAPEMPYSVWNVLSLLAIVLVLTVTGMLMTDLIRNMWTWDETYAASTPIMDTMVRMFGLEP
jgi:hypothetical protein